MKIIRLCLTSIIFLCWFYSASTQQNFSAPNLVPPSPNAAALGKYGEVPVSYYTGTPQIGVPIYTIKTGNLTLPVSLSYHSGGIRVEEVASSVGLGWSLNAGGVITKTTMGLDDFTPEIGYYYQTEKIYDIVNPTQGTPAAILHNRTMMAKIGTRYYDGEPDVFTYNIGKYSGKFYFNQRNGQFTTVPFEALKIEASVSSGMVDQFLITDPEGVRYTLSHVEVSTKSETIAGNTESVSHATSWFLSRIDDVASASFIDFVYEGFTSPVLTLGAETRTDNLPMGCQGGSGPVSNSGVFDESLVLAQRLIRINFGKGYIKFLKSAQTRCDLPGDHALEYIEVYDNNDRLVDKHKLEYSYFLAHGANINLCDLPNSRYKRLKLDKVKKISISDPNSFGAHEFSYIGNGHIADRLGYSQDYWGYYNASSNITSIPAFEYAGVHYPGTNKIAVEGTTAIGTLEEIKYPTGGKTVFIYENNRIKTYKTYDIENSFSLNAHFYYDNSTQSTVWDTEYEQEFTINEPNGGIHMMEVVCSGYNTANYNVDYGYPPYMPDYGIEMRNVNSPGQEILWALPVYDVGLGYRESSTSFRRFVVRNLPNGTYRVRMTLGDGGGLSLLVGATIGLYSSLSCHVLLPPTSMNTHENKVIGGLRIKEIKSFTSANSPRADITTAYSYNGTDGFSTGQIQSMPSPEDFYYRAISASTSGPNPEPCNYIRRTNVSNYPLITTKGGSVGYAKVTVSQINVSGENLGKTEYAYTSFADVGDIAEHGYPFVTPVNMDWQRGLLLNERIYKSSGTGFEEVRKTINGYQNFAISATPGIIGVKVGFMVQTTSDMVYEGPETAAVQDLVNAQFISFIAKPYTIHTGAMKLQSATTTTFQDPVRKIEIESNYTYNPQNMNLIQTLSTSSKNEELKEILYYKELIQTTNPALYTEMTARNMISQVLKKETFVNGNLTMRNEIVYNNWSNQFVLPKEVKSKIKTFPEKTEVEYKSYNAFGNVTEVRTIAGTKSYVYDLSDQQVVAEALNAGSNEIFYDGFEDRSGWDNGLTTFDNAKTFSGRYAGRIDGQTGTSAVSAVSVKKLTVSLAGPTAFKYSGRVFSDGAVAKIYLGMKRAGETSFYTYMDAVETSVSGKWTLLEKTFTVPADVVTMFLWIDNKNNFTNQKVWFDDLRLHPAAAQMTTYTFEPLLGMSSHTDLNNRKTTYEYDNFGRLTLARDENGNIIRKFCYNYSGQPEDCGMPPIGNAARTVLFTKNNCGTNGTGSSVPYTVEAGKYTAATQAAADALAQADIDSNGQTNANDHGTCTWTNQAQSVNFTRNDCGTNGTGAVMAYPVAAGLFSSTISLADANQQAINFGNANGQGYVNQHAGCTWTNQAQSGSLTRNNCGLNGIGSSVPYSIAAGAFSSTISLADANLKALNSAQQSANTTGTCTWFNEARTKQVTRNNCPVNFTGETIPYTILANTYTSTVSLAAANQLAQNQLDANGQNHANQYALCISNCNLNNCVGLNQRCVNGVCENGIKVYTSSQSNGGGSYTCTYHYEFSDGSWSQNMTEYTMHNCTMGGSVEN